MFCSYCGNQNDDNAKVCSTCGASLGAAEAPETPEAQPMPQQPIAQPMPQQPINQSYNWQGGPAPVNAGAPAAAASNPMVEVIVIGIIASVIYGLGAFLPDAKVWLADFALIDAGIFSDAGIVLLMALLGIAAAATPKRSVTIMIIGILQLLVVLIKTMSVGVSIPYGAGYYCLWIGGALTLITGIYGMIKRSKM